MKRSAIFAAVATALSIAGAARAEAPPAVSLWTIGSDHCVSVDADGEPWDECGFQAFAMNPDASRVLTVTVKGLVQLWDGEGREIARVDWPDERGGASSFPNGKALIAGNFGVAVVHQNQIVVLDLADGRVLSRTIADAMKFEELRSVAPDRLVGSVYMRDWDRAIREIVLPSGELRKLRVAPGEPEWSPFPSLGPSVWLIGGKAPFRIESARPEPTGAARACVPLKGRYCLFRDLPGRHLHFVDLLDGAVHTIDVGRELSPYDSVEFVVTGGRPFAAVCPDADGSPERRRCSLRDMLTGRTVHEFEIGDALRLYPGVDERGEPEIRMTILRENGREQHRVSVDGVMRAIDSAGRANLAPPGGGLILPGPTPETSVLVNRSGRAVARLPFAAQACGNGWPSWTDFCGISADGRKWLMVVPLSEQGDEPTTNRRGLELYAVPLGDEPTQK